MEKDDFRDYTDLTREDLDPELFAAALAVSISATFLGMEKASMDSLMMKTRSVWKTLNASFFVLWKMLRGRSISNATGTGSNRYFHI